MRTSDCCGAYVPDDSDLCSDCYEHCEVIEIESKGDSWLNSMFGNVKDDLTKALDISGKTIINNNKVRR